MSRSDGFTLLEVVVAALIVVTTLLGGATMFLAARGQLKRSGEQTTAIVLSQQRLEWLRSQDYDGSELAAGTTTEKLGGTYSGFGRITTIQDDTPRAGVKTITITVSSNGTNVELVSLIAE